MNNKLLISIGLVGISLFLIMCTFPGLADTQTHEIHTNTVGENLQPAITHTAFVPTQTYTVHAQPSVTSTVPIQPPHQDTVDYTVENYVTITNVSDANATKLVLWIAVIQSQEGFQELLEIESSPALDNSVVDSHGNKIGIYEFLNVGSGETVSVSLKYKVRVYPVYTAINSCDGPLINQYLQPELYLESGHSDIQQQAESITASQTSLCDMSRSIYDFVGDNLSYLQYYPEDHGALWALNNKGGDCTDFADLFIALNRSSGIPSRFVEGVTCCSTGGDSDVIKHDWAEVYLPGNGWVPVDPTWGRNPGNRDKYFAALTPDHIILTRGRNLDTLGGYHFYYFQYWYDANTPFFEHDETWKVYK